MSINEVDELAQIFNSMSMSENLIPNPIGYLNEFCQQYRYAPPDFGKPIKNGAEHTPTFVIKCKLTINGTEIVGQGEGRTVKDAKKASVEIKALLEKLGKISKSK